LGCWILFFLLHIFIQENWISFWDWEMFHDALGGSWSGLERFSPFFFLNEKHQFQFFPTLERADMVFHKCDNIWFSYLVFTIWIPNLYSEFKKKNSLKND
jgi:hypothetical protein